MARAGRNGGRHYGLDYYAASGVATGAVDGQWHLLGANGLALRLTEGEASSDCTDKCHVANAANGILFGDSDVGTTDASPVALPLWESYWITAGGSIPAYSQWWRTNATGLEGTSGDVLVGYTLNATAASSGDKVEVGYF